MSRRLLLRPFAGAALWTSTGVASGFALPSLLSSVGLAIYSPTIITTTCLVGSFALLLPMGFSRGLIVSVQDIAETHGKPAIQHAFQGGDNDKFLLSRDGKQLMEKMTLGNGWQGQLIRTLASPFLPSTTQMMVRVQEAVDASNAKEAGGQATNLNDSSNGQVVAAAAAGFIEGFLQDKKDTITMIGSCAYAVAIAVGLGIDYSCQKADEKARRWKEQQ